MEQLQFGKHSCGNMSEVWFITLECVLWSAAPCCWFVGGVCVALFSLIISVDRNIF